MNLSFGSTHLGSVRNSNTKIYYLSYYLSYFILNENKNYALLRFLEKLWN